MGFGGGRRMARGMALAVALILSIPCATAVGSPGDLDESFGVRGTVLAGFGGPLDRADSVVALPDGGIVVAGLSGSDLSCSHLWQCYWGPTDYLLQRYTPDGTLDRSFGEDGLVRRPTSGPNPEARLFAAANGALTVVTEGETERLTPGGAVQSSTRLPLGYQFAQASAGPDGRVVLANHRAINDLSDFVVTRLGTNGFPDPSFGGDGTVVLGGDSNDGIAAVAADGAVITAMQTSGGPPVMRRVLPNGTIDASYDTDLAGTLPVIRSSYFLGDLLATADGGYLLEAHSYENAYLIRGDAAGHPDPSFGEGGLAPIPTGMESADLAEAPDGSFYVAGWDQLLRVLADGTLDRGFGGGDGEATTPWLEGADVAAMADGRPVRVGFTRPLAKREKGRHFVPQSAQMATAAYETGPGPGDLDADGLLDAVDECPSALLTGDGGCGQVDRVVHLGGGRHRRLTIEISAAAAPCWSGNSQVSVFRLRRGASRLVRTVKFPERANGRRRVRVKRGRYVATVAELVAPTIGRCAADRSNVRRVRRR